MFIRRNLKSGILGIIILIVGVIIGVILVKQTQTFKNKAKEQAGQNYTVCHKTGDPKSPWIEIKADAESLPGYLNRGDIFGNCPEN